MTGSWFLLREESSDKARERLSKDIYVTGGESLRAPELAQMTFLR